MKGKIGAIQHFNGWQRLWFLLSVIWLCVCMVFAIVSFPTRETIGAEAFSRIFDSDLVKGEREAIDGIKPHCEKLYPSTVDETAARNILGRVECWKVNRLNERKIDNEKNFSNLLEKEYKKIDDSLLSTQSWAVGKMLLYWFVPTVLIYGLGMAVAWVRVGFKRES